MHKTIEVPATAALQRHLDRNPRVVSYRDLGSEDVWEITYDPTRNPGTEIHDEEFFFGRRLNK